MNMRAKMRVASVSQSKDMGGVVTSETVVFYAVSKKEGYGSDGVDENNTFARWTPNAQATFQILNPALFGQYKAGDEFYFDVTAAVMPGVELVA